MQLRFRRWRKIRKAEIPDSDKDIFERFGESAIQSILTSGLQPHHPELKEVYVRPERLKNAEKWLTERADVHERRENRLETVEWAILTIFIFSLVVESLQLLHEIGIHK